LANDEVTSEPPRSKNLGKKFVLHHNIHLLHDEKVYNLFIAKVSATNDILTTAMLLIGSLN